MTDIEFRKREVAVLEQKQSLESLRQQLAARENQLIDSEYSLRQLPTVMAGKIQPPPSSASRRSAATGLTSWGSRGRTRVDLAGQVWPICRSAPLAHGDRPKPQRAGGAV